MEKVPVLLDGYAATATAAVLHAVDPHALDHCRLAGLSPEPAHRRAAKALGLRPLLDFEVGSEGVGGGLGAGIVKAAALIHSGLVAVR